MIVYAFFPRFQKTSDIILVNQFSMSQCLFQLICLSSGLSGILFWFYPRFLWHTYLTSSLIHVCSICQPCPLRLAFSLLSGHVYWWCFPMWFLSHWILHFQCFCCFQISISVLTFLSTLLFFSIPPFIFCLSFQALDWVGLVCIYVACQHIYW